MDAPPEDPAPAASQAPAGAPEEDPQDAPVEPPFDPVRRTLGAWAWRIPVLLAAGGAIAGVVQAYRVHFAKVEPSSQPAFTDHARVAIAPLSEFAEDYATAEFFMSGIPCLAVRVPAPVPGSIPGADGHLIGFSRMCTHRACLVDLNRDLEAVAFAFNHRSDRPSLTCACHFSVFDPLRAGKAVSGPAVKPLPRVRLGVEDGWLIATGMEPSG